MTEPRELGRKSLADGGDAVNETGPIGTRSKNEETGETDRRTDKKRVVWAARRGAVVVQSVHTAQRGQDWGIKWDGHLGAQHVATVGPLPILKLLFFS